MKRRRKLGGVLVHLVLIIGALFWLAPLLLALMNSFKTNGELLTNVLSIPESLNFENYARTLDKMHYFRSLGNTVLLSGVSVTLIILFSSLAGWKLCRTKTRLSKFIFGLFVFSMLIPFSSIMIPIYRVILALKLKNSLLGLSLVYAGLGVSMAVFLYHGFVKGIPQELEEAAEMDGCGQFQVFWYMVFPLLKPITATVCITNVLWVWNDFLLPLIILTDQSNQTIPLAQYVFSSQFATNYPMAFSSYLMAMAPVLIVYIFAQKWVVGGVMRGAVK